MGLLDDILQQQESIAQNIGRRNKKVAITPQTKKIQQKARVVQDLPPAIKKGMTISSKAEEIKQDLIDIEGDQVGAAKKALIDINIQRIINDQGLSGLEKEHTTVKEYKTELEVWRERYEKISEEAGWGGFTMPDINIDIPNPFQGITDTLGNFGKYALIGLGLIAAIMFLKK